jgi:hypothetical protein
MTCIIAHVAIIDVAITTIAESVTEIKAHATVVLAVPVASSSLSFFPLFSSSSPFSWGPAAAAPTASRRAYGGAVGVSGS